MQQETLNEIYSEYLLGNVKRDKFESIIYSYLVKNKDKTCVKHWKKDEYEDFISCFYPKIKRIINSYENVGSSFEAYLHRFLLISSKEYDVKTSTNAVIECSAWSARVPDMYVYEEPPIYSTNNNENEEEITKMITGINGRKNTRRILALVLKCYYYISDDFAEKIAELIGMSAGELITMLNKIRKIRRDKDDNIYLLRERIYCQFYRCYVYEKRLSYLKENTVAYKKMCERIDAAKERLEKMRERMKNIRTDATHREIAEVIGITKGTVDASLYRLKAKWEKMSTKANLN